jgi:hypothetical protein
MEKVNLGELFVRECVRAIPWGIIVIVLIFLAITMEKQNMKEAIEYAARVSIREAKAAVLEPATFVPLKQKVKAAIEYTARVSAREAKAAVLEPATFVPLKQNVKEAIEFTARTAANEYKRVQLELRQRGEIR